MKRWEAIMIFHTESFLLLTVHFHLHLPMSAFYRKGDQKRTPKYISPPLSVVFLLHPKRGMSAYVRFDQKWGTKKPDLLWQIRKKVVEVTGFEPATFWSRTKRATKLRYTSKMEPMKGLEPLTCWLRIGCSTNWATSARSSSPLTVKNYTTSGRLCPVEKAGMRIFNNWAGEKERADRGK